MKSVELRTGIWYNDHLFELAFPDSWDVVTYWPDTPPPLTDKEIRAIIDNPIGQPPLRALAKGKKRPIVIVDDLARPTPVFRIMPLLLEEFYSAGLDAHQIRILVATGTHGNQDKTALANKIGKASFESCRVIVHNDKKHSRFIGKTSFGTPVYVNPEALESDLVIGIGGIYPQHTTGFGGGGKLALGILGRKSILHLHYGNHGSVGGTYNIENNFRRDVTEMARMIGLNTIFTLHINGQLEVVNLTCGDHFTYYAKAAEFSRKAYKAPLPGQADVVIANTYPSDVSYTFMRKGLKPLRLAPPIPTKIAIGSNSEGIGRHGIFPQGGNPRLNQYKALFFRMSTMNYRVILSKILKNLLPAEKPPEEIQWKPEIIENLWLYRPEGSYTAPLASLDGIGIVESWERMLGIIKRNHASKTKIKVRIYPCASLQCLEDKGPLLKTDESAL
jgi:nickel-dependent lactate racemase